MRAPPPQRKQLPWSTERSGSPASGGRRDAAGESGSWRARRGRGRGPGQPASGPSSAAVRGRSQRRWPWRKPWAAPAERRQKIRRQWTEKRALPFPLLFSLFLYLQTKSVDFLNFVGLKLLIVFLWFWFLASFIHQNESFDKKILSIFSR